MNVQASTVAEIQAAPEFDALGIEYAAESQINGMPPAKPDWEKYRLMEAAGMLYVWSATEGDRLAGYISLIVSPHPRYSIPITATESWFVARAHRKSGGGLKLLKMAEEKSLELTGRYPLVSAPVGGTLSEVLPHLGYSEASTIFFKQVADA